MWQGQYGLVNGARYGNALDITTNELGLFMQPVTLFRFHHPSLFIPWSELHDPQPVVVRQRQLVRFEVGHPRVGTLALPRALLEQSEGRRLLQTDIAPARG